MTDNTIGKGKEWANKFFYPIGLLALGYAFIKMIECEMTTPC